MNYTADAASETALTAVSAEFPVISAELASDAPEALYRARRLVLEGDHAGAAGVLREFVARRPRHGVAWQRLAGALIGAGESDDAREAAARAVELTPDDPAARRMQAIALFVAGEYGSAVDAANEALRLDPNDVQAHLVLAEALLRLPDADGLARADDAVAKALAIDPYSRPAVVCRRWIAHVRRAPTLLLGYAMGTGLAVVFGFSGPFVLLGGLGREGFLLTVTGLVGLGVVVLSLRALHQPRRHGRNRAELLADFAAVHPRPVQTVVGVILTGAAAWAAALAASGTPRIRLGMAAVVVVVTLATLRSAWSKVAKERA